MGICSNNKYIQNCILCNNPPEENNYIIINLDKNDEEKNKENKNVKKNEINNFFKQDDSIENPNNQLLNGSNQNNDNIIVYNINSKFKSKFLKSSLKSSLNNVNEKNREQENKYKISNEKFDKLIHFTNFNNNFSVTTNSIIK